MNRLTLLIAAIVAALPAAASAEIAMLTNGRTLKVTSFAVSGESAELLLTAGGKVVMPLERIERIVDDEVVPVPAALVDEPAVEARSWRYDANRGPLFGSPYDPIIVAAARKFDVDAALVSAVIKAESDYDARIVSHKGAQGLMQLMPATARRFGVANAFDPVANIHAGTKYLAWLLDRFDGDVELALAGYNAGEGNVAKYRGVPPFRETVQYIRRIGRHLSRLEPVELSSVASLR